ncbi:MAG TPA: FAD-binding oxidoreductase [Thermoanaerobaculia bacterium]|nr:FAD-binding oxidoreductase [Thermoanaerobaculia bacterium]
MTAFSRPAAGEDAILGVRPETVFEPSTVEEAAEVVGESARRGKTLAFVGGGTDLELGAQPSRLDAVVKTGRLARIVEHAPSDQIVVVEAGMTLGGLQAALVLHRQRLALDPPLPGRKTMGGIIAANAYGPRRARFGSVRDLIIGISFVRADGSLARGGGKVVKNVAGFDLPKLMVGSLGTLGLITTATFRLHPLPEEEVTLLLPGRTAGAVRALVAAVKKAQLEPTSVVGAWRENDRFDVAVRFEGFRSGVAEQRERLAGLVRDEAGGACETLDESAARALWSRHDELRAAPALRAKLTALPTHIEPITKDILPGLLGALGSPSFLWYATLGLGFLAGSPADAGSAAAAIQSARERVAGLGGTMTLQATPAAIRERLDVWGGGAAPPPALALMQSVKNRLDPQRRLAPGRFVGGI